MKGKLILPPNYVSIKGPLIFLAGPMTGAPKWQDKAIKFIQDNAPEINIASPRKDYLEGEFVWEKQVDWETHYLNKAAENGVILFWLAKEAEHLCGRAYARTSRFELGEWKERNIKDNVKLIVGIEEGFNGARYIKRRLSQDCQNMKIYNSLEETCLKAIELCK